MNYGTVIYYSILAFMIFVFIMHPFVSRVIGKYMFEKYWQHDKYIMHLLENTEYFDINNFWEGNAPRRKVLREYLVDAKCNIFMDLVLSYYYDNEAKKLAAKEFRDEYNEIKRKTEHNINPLRPKAQYAPETWDPKDGEIYRK